MKCNNYLSVIFYLCLAHTFSTFEANQNIGQADLQRIRSANRLQPGFQNLVSRLMEEHQQRTELQKQELQKVDESDRSIEQLSEEENRIAWLKKTLLEKLKLTAPPNISSSEKLPLDSPVMRALFKEYGIDQSRIEEEDDDVIKSQKVISTAKPLPFNVTGSKENWFFFEFAPEEQENFRVKSANIWFYIRDTTSRAQAQIQLDVFRSFLNTTDGEFTYTPQKHSVKHLNLADRKNRETWMHFPVTGVVSSWLQNPSKNFGVKLYSKQIRNLIANGLLSNEAGYKPFLEVQLVTDHHRRKRSAQNECHETEDGSQTCCIKDFNINFHSIGWDFIIYPTTYNAKECKGKCYPDTSNIFHAQASNSQQQQTNNREAQIGRMNSPRNCCVPTKYKPLTMLFYDSQKNIVYSDIPDMIIKKCSCM